MFSCFAIALNIDFHMAHHPQMLFIPLLKKACNLLFILYVCMCLMDSAYLIFHLTHWMSSHFFLTISVIFWTYLSSSTACIPCPSTSLLSLEHVLFSLANHSETSWIALVLGQIPVKTHSVCLILTVSHWKLLSKCSFLLVNLLCYAAYLYTSFWLIFEIWNYSFTLEAQLVFIFKKLLTIPSLQSQLIMFEIFKWIAVYFQ